MASTLPPSTAHHPPTLTTLPPEILSQILAHVPLPDLVGSVRQVNRLLFSTVPIHCLQDQLLNPNHIISIRPTDLRDGGLSHRCLRLRCTSLDPSSLTATFQPILAMPECKEEGSSSSSSSSPSSILSELWFDAFNACEKGNHMVQLDHASWMPPHLRQEFPFSLPWGNDPRRLLALDPQSGLAQSPELSLTYHSHAHEERVPCACRQPPEHYHTRRTLYIHVESLRVNLSWILSGFAPSPPQ